MTTTSPARTPRITPRRAALALTALTLGCIGIAATPGDPATAATAATGTCATAAANPAEAAMCGSAWRLTNLTPMSNRGVITAGHEYCNLKKLRGATVAINAMRSHYGTTKGNALSDAAEAWLC